MGSAGSDIMLSETAMKRFPFNVECKKLAAFSVYKHYQQAQDHNKNEQIPLVVIEGNRKSPLVLLSLYDFMELNKDAYVGRQTKSKDSAA